MSDKSEPSVPNLPLALENGGIIKELDSVAPGGWRLKFARAAAQLIAGSERGALIYGEVRERLDIIEGRSTVSKALAEAVANQAINDPDVLERARARFLGSALQKQENVEAVIREAAAANLALPSPAYPSTFEANEVDNEPVANGSEVAQPLDSDWASTFTPLAEVADSDKLRTRLSKILAGELRSPGAFPRSTLRRIWEMDQEDLEALSSVKDRIFKDWISPEANMGVDLTNHLLEANLIHDTAAKTFTRPLTTSPDNPGGMYGKTYAISIASDVVCNFNFGGTPLTKLGSSVLSLLEGYDELQALKNFSETIPKNGVTIIHCGNYQITGDNKFSIVNPVVLFKRHDLT